jgi:hypothetical protein
MSNVHRSTEASTPVEPFEAPELTPIGDAGTVVQGFFGVGWDGPNGMTSPEFEFAPDGAE